MNTTTRIAAVGLTAALTLSACGFGGDSGGSDDAAEGTTALDLLVPSYSDQTQALWEGIISDFEAENSDITVSLDVQSWDNINDVVRTRIQSDEAPDILNIDAFAGFAADDLLFPAADVLSQETLDDFQPSFAENASVDGEMYGLPLIASARALFYNQALLTQAGVDAPPTTWDELLADATAISALGNGVYGYGMPLGSEEAQAETSIWTFGGGGSWGDDAEITVDTPENLAAVEFMQQMIEAGATQPDPGASDRTPMLDVFVQGQIGMAVGLPPTVGQIEENNPELDYGTAPIPTQDGEPVTLGVADHLMAFTNDDGAKQDAIRTFLDYFFSADVYTGFVDAEGFLPTTQSGSEALADKEEIATFLEALPDAQFYPSTNPSWSAAQGAMQTNIGTIAQGADPATVLADVQAAADAGS